jgi:hypothetical protein
MIIELCIFIMMLCQVVNTMVKLASYYREEYNPEEMTEEVKRIYT